MNFHIKVKFMYIFKGVGRLNGVVSLVKSPFWSCDKVNQGIHLSHEQVLKKRRVDSLFLSSEHMGPSFFIFQTRED